MVFVCSCKGKEQRPMKWRKFAPCYSRVSKIHPVNSPVLKNWSKRKHLGKSKVRPVGDFGPRLSKLWPVLIHASRRFRLMSKQDSQKCADNCTCSCAFGRC